MRQFILLILIAMVFASVIADAQTKSPPPANADETAKEIRAWFERWTQALKTKDLDEIMALYADDVIAFDVVPPLQYVGKSAYRGDYQQFLSQYEGNLNVELRDLRVGVEGDLGHATALEMISGTLKTGQQSNVWVRVTSLFRKSDGRWLDFHDHVSVPADFRSGKAMLQLKP